jgi:DNA-binding response OmpR family regulator
MPLSLLIVEDNAALARNLEEGIVRAGHRADFAANGRHGLQLALENSYDVVVLDLALPLMDGLEVCRRLRAEAPKRVPVLMLTARDTLQDKLSGFDSGADDYLVKPFALEELLARCTALGQRHSLHQTAVLTVGSLTIDRSTHLVQREGVELKVSQTGFRILKLLAENHPRVLTRSELADRLWQGEPPDSDALRTHLYQLRQVLDKPFGRPMLLTVHGVGFKLDPEA